MSQYIEMMHQTGELKNLQSMLLLSYAPLNSRFSLNYLEDYSLNIQGLDNYENQNEEN